MTLTFSLKDFGTSYNHLIICGYLITFYYFTLVHLALCCFNLYCGGFILFRVCVCVCVCVCVYGGVVMCVYLCEFCNVWVFW
jgi:hypothetical protein